MIKAMIKLWWGITWRFYLVSLVIGAPVTILYALIEPTAFTIKVKPTFFYLLIALLMTLIGNLDRLNNFIWQSIVDIKFAKLITFSLAIVALISSLLNLLVAFNSTVDEYVEAKITIGIFSFLICPFVVAFFVKFKESELTNIN